MQKTQSTWPRPSAALIFRNVGDLVTQVFLDHEGAVALAGVILFTSMGIWGMKAYDKSSAEKSQLHGPEEAAIQCAVNSSVSLSNALIENGALVVTKAGFADSDHWVQSRFSQQLGSHTLYVSGTIRNTEKHTVDDKTVIDPGQNILGEWHLEIDQLDPKGPSRVNPGDRALVSMMNHCATHRQNF